VATFDVLASRNKLTGRQTLQNVILSWSYSTAHNRTKGYPFRYSRASMLW
jgi:hypothetical protein